MAVEASLTSQGQDVASFHNHGLWPNDVLIPTTGIASFTYDWTRRPCSIALQRAWDHTCKCDPNPYALSRVCHAMGKVQSDW